MSLIIKNFKDSMSLFKQDKGLLLLGLIPLVIGIIVYSLVGKLIYVDFLAYLNSYLEGQIGSEGWFQVAKVILTALLSLLLYFLISWTFISVVGIFACPFNDLMAGRVEINYLGHKTD
jgi:CysZ protein